MPVAALSPRDCRFLEHESRLFGGLDVEERACGTIRGRRARELAEETMCVAERLRRSCDLRGGNRPELPRRFERPLVVNGSLAARMDCAGLLRCAQRIAPGAIELLR